MLILGSGAALASTPKLPPRHMTIGLLQLLCKKDGKSLDSSDQSSNAYCQGYLNGIIDAYFERPSVKRASHKRNVCKLYQSTDWLRDELRREILAISDERDLNLDYGLTAEPWIMVRIVAKCEPKK
jgi:hypothetical protein